MEDVIETLLGIEIVDEGDKIEDMQQLARKLWRKRAQSFGMDNIKRASNEGANTSERALLKKRNKNLVLADMKS